MNREIGKWKTKIFQYGVLTVLYVLQYLEEKENYIECQNIVDTIRHLEKELYTDFFTVINEESIKKIIDYYKVFGLTGVNAVNNSKYYADMIIIEFKL